MVLLVMRIFFSPHWYILSDAFSKISLFDVKQDQLMGKSVHFHSDLHFLYVGVHLHAISRCTHLHKPHTHTSFSHCSLLLCSVSTCNPTPGVMGRTKIQPPTWCLRERHSADGVGLKCNYCIYCFSCFFFHLALFRNIKKHILLCL